MYCIVQKRYEKIPQQQNNKRTKQFVSPADKWEISQTIQQLKNIEIVLDKFICSISCIHTTSNI